MQDLSSGNSYKEKYKGMTMSEQEHVKLDEKVITKEELQKIKEELPKDKRIVEVGSEEFKTLTRMQE